MKFIISKKVFSYGLSRIRSVSRYNNTVYMRTVDDMLEIKSGNLEISLLCKYKPEEIIADGETATNAYILSEIAREMPDENISFELINNSLARLTCKGVISFDIPCKDTLDFPDLSVDNGAMFAITAGVFGEMISKVVFAIAGDDYACRSINGALLQRLEEDDYTIRMAGTDGGRFVVIDREKEHDLSDNCDALQNGIIIPKKGLLEINRLCNSNSQDDTIKVKINNNIMNLECNNTRLYLRLIEGSFVDYKNILNTTFANYFTANRKELLAILQRASVVADNNGVQLKSNGSGRLSVSAENYDQSSLSESLEAQCEGEPVNARLNHYYLMDVLKALDTESVRISHIPTMLHIQNDTYNCFIAPYRSADFDHI